MKFVFGIICPEDMEKFAAMNRELTKNSGDELLVRLEKIILEAFMSIGTDGERVDMHPHAQMAMIEISENTRIMCINQEECKLFVLIVPEGECYCAVSKNALVTTNKKLMGSLPKFINKFCDILDVAETKKCAGCRYYLRLLRKLARAAKYRYKSVTQKYLQ